MKKALTIAALAALTAVPAFARYIVVLTDGKTYAAKAKWTVVNGKAIVQLENGQSLQLDPALIDVRKSEAMTKVGMANANIIDLNPAATSNQQQKQQQTLGDTIKLRKPQSQPAQSAPAPAPTPAPVTGGGTMSSEVIAKFDRAFDNLGIFEKKIVSTSARSLRAEITVDTEDRVFNAISATSLLMVKNAGVDNAQIDVVELFMKTTTGGSAGRFQMTRADAEPIEKATPATREAILRDYFIRKVIY